MIALLLTMLPARPIGAAPPPPAERITQNIVRIGGAVADLRAGEVTCTGVVSVDTGAVEYLAAAPGGKLYESVLRLDVRPLHLQLALILIGLQGQNGLKQQGDTAVPKGSRVEILIRWREASGRQREIRAADLFGPLAERRAFSPPGWTFTGSRVLKEGFEADLEHSIAAVWRDPAALLNNSADSGADNNFKVRHDRVPPRGTPVQFVIRAHIQEARR